MEKIKCATCDNEADIRQVYEFNDTVMNMYFTVPGNPFERMHYCDKCLMGFIKQIYFNWLVERAYERNR